MTEYQRKQRVALLLRRGVSKKRRVALRMKRAMLAYRILSTSAIKRANELLMLRHHDGSYQQRGCGTRTVSLPKGS